MTKLSANLQRVVAAAPRRASSGAMAVSDTFGKRARSTASSRRLGGEDIPPAWISATGAPGGRLIAPTATSGRGQVLVVLDHVVDRWRQPLGPQLNMRPCFSSP